MTFWNANNASGQPWLRWLHKDPPLFRLCVMWCAKLYSLTKSLSVLSLVSEFTSDINKARTFKAKANNNQRQGHSAKAKAIPQCKLLEIK